MSRTGDTRGQDPVVAVVNDRVAPTINAAFGQKLGLDNQHIDSGAGLFVYHEQPIAFTARGEGADAQHGVTPTMRSLTCGADGHQSGAAGLAVCHPINTQIAMRHEAMGERTGMGVGEDGDVGFTLQAAHSHAVAFSAGNSSDSRSIGYSEEHTPPLRAGASATNMTPTIMSNMQVRRLTPRECERLQAFPDNYTNIPGASDTTRYKALGNSMAVNVMQLIGQRIQYVESVL